MNIETIINELKHCTSPQLQTLSGAIAAERQSRENEKLKELIEKTCANLRELDTMLNDTIEVTVSSYGEDFGGYLDLLNLCEALREYIP